MNEHCSELEGRSDFHLVCPKSSQFALANFVVAAIRNQLLGQFARTVNGLKITDADFFNTHRAVGDVHQTHLCQSVFVSGLHRRHVAHP